ncbi:hypothetical protein HII17_10975 [Thalassotalea sp. M1531]|uniref:Lipoprotein n=1 Tax=Thalassotalea algicola TaxID=2716224 RepID=A0A7Y0Q7E2_9GAMM|nr:hypothetical protein [Thalassotalea algicola]NMP32091.1 hypothetical protein [Thalassotalea algicola]
MNKSLIILLLSTLTACGGGSESTKEPTISSTIAPQSSDIDITTGELISTPEFSFIGSFDLTINIAEAPEGSIQYYINICSEFTEENNEIIVNYDSCMLRTFLTSQPQSFELALSESQSTLVAQIWPMENNAVVIDVFWQKQGEVSVWNISI